jgi:hypothetical protein
MSLTLLFRSNSSRASCLISRLADLSEIRAVLRKICRHNAKALPLCKNYFGVSSNQSVAIDRNQAEGGPTYMVQTNTSTKSRRAFSSRRRKASGLMPCSTFKVHQASHVRWKIEFPQYLLVVESCIDCLLGPSSLNCRDHF